MEQGLRKLKVNKKKIFIVETVYIAAVKSSSIPNPYLLPLSNSFNFDFSFSILLNIISNNIFISFL